MKVSTGWVLQLLLGSCSVMLVPATFTPKDLLSEPRRSVAAPNPDGTKALFTTTQYSFETHSRNKTFSFLDPKNGKVSVALDDASASEIFWIGDSIAFLKGSEDTPGGTDLWIINGDSKYKAAMFPGSVSGFQSRQHEDGSVKFVVTASAYSNGTMYNSATAPKKYTSGRVYTSLFVRHWDTYIEEWRNNLFSGSLSLKDGAWSLSATRFVNVMACAGLESPIPPFGGTDNYDTNPKFDIVAFVAKDPELNAAINTASYVYIASLKGGEAPKPINKPSSNHKPAGASTSPTWSPDGKKLAFLQMPENGYESDRNQIFIYEDGKITSLVPDWDRSPAKVSWSSDGAYLYLLAEEYGRVKLWVLPSDPKKIEGHPKVILGNEGSINDYAVLGNSAKLLVSSTSVVSPTYYSVLNAMTGDVKIIFDPKAQSTTGSATLKRSQVDDFWVTRKDGVKIHSWIIKPTFFQEGKKYPLAAWVDSWSTRWNPAVFAERGYIVITPNPTGSTGYGEKFTDAIQNDWGGAPYNDLVKVYEYALKKFKFIDEDRTVALGASYGGFMINWIQGNPLGKKFKALVCHDGCFSTMNQYSSEELWFPMRDFGGSMITHPQNYARWNPANLIKNWSTPELIIHNELDYRLPISEGLAPFNVLQEKGIPSKFLTFPDENHWVLNPENSLLWHSEVIGWINHWVGIDDKSFKETRDIALQKESRDLVDRAQVHARAVKHELVDTRRTDM
ncbi:Alpha/Beta hydrolase protein [Kalaharituber pfeilii]|nr:Alpha/Beta hydrolase protein [Kalaharituber pfeilii]